MAITAQWFGKALEGQFGGTSARRVDWAADTIKVMLTTSSYAPDQDAHDFANDVTNEVAGAGYTAGGQALANKAVSYRGADNTLLLDADDLSWTSGVVARRAVIYKDTGTPSTSPLLGVVDFGADVGGGTTLTLQWSADGVLKLVAS